MSLSNDKREIDEYQDESNKNESSSSDSDSTNKQYSFGVPRVPLKVLQEEMRKRETFRSSADPSTNAQLSTHSPNEEEDILYCYAMDIPFKIDEKRLYTLRDKYQILDEVNPRLAIPGE